MPKITYTGPDQLSPEIKVAPASYLSLPRGVPCAVDVAHAKLLLAAGPHFTGESQTPDPVVPKTKKGATP